ncbi:MAG: serine hydrolase domain-containing protein [Bacteroidia bacterium]
MLNHCKLLIITLLLGIGCGGSAVKQLPEASNFDQAINFAGTEYITNGPVAGCVVGVIRNGKREVYAFGTKDLKADEKPDEQTIFEIGSITKTFTATLLADLIIAGICKPEDPVKNFLPDLSINEFENTPITLLDLTTHTSGLPRMPSNIGFYILKDAENPYAAYPVSELYSWLSKYKPEKAPGNSFEYSNLGVGLLGHTLGKINQSDYEQSLQQRVLFPLKMTHTTLSLTDSQRQNLALPYSKKDLVSNWDFTDAFAAAGAIKSNLSDMFLYLEAQMGITHSSLDSAISLTHIPQRPDGNRGQIGMGWMIRTSDDGKITLWHNGATGGYQSFIGFMPEENIGIVILMNTATSSTQEATNSGFYLLNAASKQ